MRDSDMISPSASAQRRKCHAASVKHSASGKDCKQG